jgi:hypothetical protein
LRSSNREVFCSFLFHQAAHARDGERDEGKLPRPIDEAMPAVLERSCWHTGEPCQKTLIGREAAGAVVVRGHVAPFVVLVDCQPFVLMP